MEDATAEDSKQIAFELMKYSFQPLMVLVPVLGLTLTGCVKDSSWGDLGKLRIDAVDTNRWTASFGVSEVISIKGYRFLISTNTDLVFKVRKASNLATLRSIRSNLSMPSRDYLRQSFERELIQYESGEYNYVGNWSNWPIVMTFRQMRETPKDYKVLTVCRSENYQIEVALIFTVPRELSEKTIAEIARGILEQPGDKKTGALVRLSSRPGAIFSADESLGDPLLRVEMESDAFLKQK